MKKTLLVSILALQTLFGGSADAIFECHTGTGRTQLNFKDDNLQGVFNGGTLTIDGKTISYPPRDGGVISKLNKGVYTISLSYKQNNEYIHLKFYALPNSVKSKEVPYGEGYTFSAIIDGDTTDPRTSNYLRKNIFLACTATYSI